MSETASAPPPSSNPPSNPNPNPNGPPHTLPTLCSSLRAQVNAFLQEDVPTERLKRVQAQTRISLSVIQEALRRYEYVESPLPFSPLYSHRCSARWLTGSLAYSPSSLPTLSLSYNGGKDCLVLLILYLASLPPHLHLLPSSPARSPSALLLPSIYIQPPHPFASVDAFVASSSAHYHLTLATFARASMKDAFRDYLLAEREGGREVQAIFVGTRRTDPNGGQLGFFDRTDGGWPEFMRVHPVIEWRYGEVWAFLRHLRIPYCELYDRGYTSLGGTTDTHPNPALRREGGEEGFRPAYELEADEEERLGRDR
ncbi:hypothetical protein MMC20_000208 [Loxospora ochrophaea]|nr:hypothetical protein [Loxospora ochrophaea]